MKILDRRSRRGYRGPGGTSDHREHLERLCQTRLVFRVELNLLYRECFALHYLRDLEFCVTDDHTLLLRDYTSRGLSSRTLSPLFAIPKDDYTRGLLRTM